MLLISHPTGNSFVRGLLEGAMSRGCLGRFATTVGFSHDARWRASVPNFFSDEIQRRTYSIPQEKLWSRPARETVRLAVSRLGTSPLTRHETGWASVDAVYQDLDQKVASQLREWHHNLNLTVAYAYEDGALQTFHSAHKLGMRTVYELPITYWQTAQLWLREEAERWPEWEPTLGATRDSEAKLERKAAELAAAEIVVCPSRFVEDSIPASLRCGRSIVVAEFGSPPAVPRRTSMVAKRPLRVLFAGALTQRKGLADLFAAVRLLPVDAIELILMGSVVLPMEFYRRQNVAFTYEPPRPHAEVLKLMQTCDLLVLPSICEGRALVQQEAMACGLPILITPNTGGADLVVEGVTGFCVPVRAPQQIAEKIAWCAANRESVFNMGLAAQQLVQTLTWERYSNKILDAVISPSAKAEAQSENVINVPGQAEPQIR